MLRVLLEDGMVGVDLLQHLEGVEGDQLNVGDDPRQVDCLVRLEPLSKQNLKRAIYNICSNSWTRSYKKFQRRLKLYFAMPKIL